MNGMLRCGFLEVGSWKLEVGRTGRTGVCKLPTSIFQLPSSILVT
jgi:hypothetical protein